MASSESGELNASEAGAIRRIDSDTAKKDRKEFGMG
jgi:hypothetical protein